MKSTHTAWRPWQLWSCKSRNPAYQGYPGWNLWRVQRRCCAQRRTAFNYPYLSNSGTKQLVSLNPPWTHNGTSDSTSKSALSCHNECRPTHDTHHAHVQPPRTSRALNGNPRCSWWSRSPSNDNQQWLALLRDVIVVTHLCVSSFNLNSGNKTNPDLVLTTRFTISSFCGSFLTQKISPTHLENYQSDLNQISWPSRKSYTFNISSSRRRRSREKTRYSQNKKKK